MSKWYGNLKLSWRERKARLDGLVKLEGREDFVRENAMSLLRQRDEKLLRMQRRIAQLEQSNKTYRQQLTELRARLAALEEY